MLATHPPNVKKKMEALHQIQLKPFLVNTPQKKADRISNSIGLMQLKKNSFSYLLPMIASFAAFATRNFTTVFAGI